MLFVYIAHIINILVAGYFGLILGFFCKQKSREAPYGIDTPGSRILASQYLTIALISIFALLFQEYLVLISVFLFIFQVIYKTLSAVTVRSLKNPVVICNLLIALFHSYATYTIINQFGFSVFVNP